MPESITGFGKGKLLTWEWESELKKEREGSWVRDMWLR